MYIPYTIYIYIYIYIYICYMMYIIYMPYIRLCIDVCIYIYGCLSIKGQKQGFSAILAFTFIHRYIGTNKPHWQNVAFDLAI